MDNTKKYKIVILDGPYDTIQRSQFVRKLFANTIALKLDGYLTHYPHGVLPIDTNDFIGVHQLICEINELGELIPVVCCKSMNIQKCQKHQVEFPLLSLLRNSNAKEHLQYLENFIATRIDKCHNLTYDSSFTINPTTTTNRADRHLLKELMAAMHCSYHLEYKTSYLFGLGVPRFSTDQLFETWGYVRSAIDGNKLPPFKLKALFGEEVVMFDHPGVWGPFAMAMAKKYETLWSERLTIEQNGLAADLIKKVG